MPKPPAPRFPWRTSSRSECDRPAGCDIAGQLEVESEAGSWRYHLIRSAQARRVAVVRGHERANTVGKGLDGKITPAVERPNGIDAYGLQLHPRIRSTVFK